MPVSPALPASTPNRTAFEDGTRVTYSPWIASFNAALFATVATTATAAPVKELKPAEVAAFVAAHPYAIVQVTSPDRGCGDWVGADKAFDAAAAAATGKRFAFARAQHSPWRAMPDWGQLMTIHGVPGEAVFRDGKQLGTVDGMRDTPDPPAGADRYSAALAQWSQPRKAALNQAALLLLKGEVDMKPIANDEANTLRT